MGMKPRHPYLSTDRPWAMAHRGDSVNAPANTMIAFRKAVEAGADVLELDVHWTSDGVVVVSHDDTVDAMSDGHGAIADMSLAELKELDFGYRYSNDGGRTFPFRNKQVTIATLREVLETFSHVRVNMDIKPRRLISLGALMTDIADCKAFERVLVASFHHKTLTLVRQMNRAVATSASPSEVARFVLEDKLKMKAGRRLPYVALQVPPNMGRLTVVTPTFVQRAHEMQIAVHVWTIDDERTMESLFDLGVDGVVSNDARLVVAVRDRVVSSKRKREPLDYGEG